MNTIIRIIHLNGKCQVKNITQIQDENSMNNMPTYMVWNILSLTSNLTDNVTHVQSSPHPYHHYSTYKTFLCKKFN